ncbi:UNVERIFIED_CONTAM: hypothetical protein Sradi_3875500 [Sesamum radiatum]|uniref:Uncharacterized protein n=1 Tax=Sesamum radiatum TaxID=300843 RepID=A0AAW2Q235_SESRA
MLGYPRCLFNGLTLHLNKLPGRIIVPLLQSFLTSILGDKEKEKEGDVTTLTGNATLKIGRSMKTGEKQRSIKSKIEFGNEGSKRGANDIVLGELGCAGGIGDLKEDDVALDNVICPVKGHVSTIEEVPGGPSSVN